MFVTARGLLAGLLLGLLFVLLLTAAVQGLRLPSFEPILLGPFRWEVVIGLA
jgi:hypothetical protein